MLLHNVKKQKRYSKNSVENLKTLKKKFNLIFGPYRASALIMLDTQKFRVQNFNTFSIIPENLNVLSWIVLEELTGQNDLLKITKPAIFQTGSVVLKIRLEIFYSRTIPTIPENFMKIYRRVWEKSSKKNKNKDRKT